MPEITFFMIVTPREAVISDFCIRSLGKLWGQVDFRLVVYSNYLLPRQKEWYFPRWSVLPYVELRRNEHHDAGIPEMQRRMLTDKRMAGPFEYCEPIWDRELPSFDTPFVATVDSDLEILRADFAHHMLGALKADPLMIGFSTDYSPIAVAWESYTKDWVILNERNLAFFCIYKREAFQRSQVSFSYHQEILNSSSVKRNAWDSGGWFQKSLRDQGFTFGNLGGAFRRDYIHYGAFANNTTINRRNVRLYRAIRLAEHALHPRLGSYARRLRERLLPGLENNRFQWDREAPVNW